MRIISKKIADFIKHNRLTYCFYGGERGIRTLGGAFTPHSLSRRAPSASSAISPRHLCKTSPFVQFRRQAQILSLEILNVFLHLIPLAAGSPSLNLNPAASGKHFSKVSSNQFKLAEGVGFEPTEL